VPAATRNFNLAVRCPGIHWEKTHNWPDTQIMQQQGVEQSEIVACEQWAAAQPKGYVPPPPPGVPPAGGGKAPAAMPSPAAGGAQSSAAAGAPAAP
jgi:hypothetical protein